VVLVKAAEIIAATKPMYAEMNKELALHGLSLQFLHKGFQQKSKNDRRSTYDSQTRRKQATLSQGLRTGRKERAVTARQLRRAGA
jgi:hypothetical protein